VKGEKEMAEYATCPGVGVLISRLFGNQATVDALEASRDKEIATIGIDEERLLLTFIDGTAVRLYDDGQSCCEHRYMHTDDQIQDFVGALFKGAEVRDGPTEMDEWDDPKESQFLIITTSIGQFTVVNYNEHNGYYGGFALKAEQV